MTFCPMTLIKYAMCEFKVGKDVDERRHRQPKQKCGGKRSKRPTLWSDFVLHQRFGYLEGTFLFFTSDYSGANLHR